MNSTSHDRGFKREPSPLASAAWDLRTSIPAAAALIIAATDTDHNISRWASEHNPVYGSQSSAESTSNDLRGLLAVSALTTTFVSPGKQGVTLSGRTGNLVMGVTSAATISVLTNELKDSIGRTRPNGVDQRSMPSSHTSAASTYATISSYRVDELSISDGKRQFLKAGFVTLAAATAWARVEAKAHYPTDVLVGFSLGNFTTMLLHETLQRPQHSPQIGIMLDRKHDMFQIMMSMPF